MRKVNVSKIREAVKNLSIQTNLEAAPDLIKALKKYQKQETSSIGGILFKEMLENINIARYKKIPICQDTGITVVFLEIGQEVLLVGGEVETAINEGVKQGYKEGYLRKSVVKDPLNRKNTGDNTPAVIHYRIVPGEKVKITVAPKGFGSENMSKITMLKPTEGIVAIKKFVLDTVKAGGSNFCPPIVIGIGIGGSFEKAALLSKEALLRPLGRYNKKKHLADLEKEIFKDVNSLGVGAQGLGGKITTIGVHILDYATHIAGLPVAVNTCCHVYRHGSVTI